ncbi:MAG TPA: SHOCT domain-containing protein [Candidatus Elarobacter sp.]|jgi:hypothetical protein|nr:SHOCT domain-containing protein [Candidatus Elarobacter sp.]
MRYVTNPRWVYYMLVVMGIGFMAGSAAFMLWVPQPTGAIVGVIWLLMGAGFVFFSLRALANRRDDERIARTGTRASATVLSANMTGMFINEVPQWALHLRIDGYGAPYETKMKLLTYSPPANGATFTVRIDPARRDHVVMAPDDADTSAASAANAGAAGAGSSSAFSATSTLAPDVRSAVLEALRKAGLGDGDNATTTENADGSRTITMTSVDGVSHVGGAPHDAADTVKLLAELDRMRASGALGQDEFDAMKRKLLEES